LLGPPFPRSALQPRGSRFALACRSAFRCCYFWRAALARPRRRLWSAQGDRKRSIRAWAPDASFASTSVAFGLSGAIDYRTNPGVERSS
jgi:hypothetical protein